MYLDNVDGHIWYMVEEGVWKDSGFIPSSATWYNFVIVRDGGDLYFYSDANEEQKTTCTTGALTNNSYGVLIGTRRSLNDFSNNQIDEVGIWKGHAMSAGEVSALYNAGTGAFYK